MTLTRKLFRESAEQPQLQTIWETNTTSLTDCKDLSMKQPHSAPGDIWAAFGPVVKTMSVTISWWKWGKIEKWWHGFLFCVATSRMTVGSRLCNRTSLGVHVVPIVTSTSSLSFFYQQISEHWVLLHGCKLWFAKLKAAWLWYRSNGAPVCHYCCSIKMVRSMPYKTDLETEDHLKGIYRSTGY